MVPNEWKGIYELEGRNADLYGNRKNPHAYMVGCFILEFMQK